MLRDLFATDRKLTLRWHEPEMSFLEGVFSRGGRELAPAVEAAYREGALFCSWVDRFDLAPWLRAFAATGIAPEDWLKERDPDRPLAWEHLSCGVGEGFLRRERDRAVAGRATPDCRFGACAGCGVCNYDGRVTELAAQANCDIRPHVNRPAPEREAVAVPAAPPREDLTAKAVHFRLWFSKTGSAVYLSQLELGRVFERALRRAGLKPSFSSGYHPLPQMSFGRALPVGVASRAEWLAIFLREHASPEEFAARLGPGLPEGLGVVAVEDLPPGKKVPQPVLESFELTVPGALAPACLENWRQFAAAASVPIFWTTKKGGRSLDARLLVVAVDVVEPAAVRFTCRFDTAYISPLRLVETVCPELVRGGYDLVKTGVAFADGRPLPAPGRS